MFLFMVLNCMKIIIFDVKEVMDCVGVEGTHGGQGLANTWTHKTLLLRCIDHPYIALYCTTLHYIAAAPRLTWHVSWGRRLPSLISLPVHGQPANTLLHHPYHCNALHCCALKQIAMHYSAVQCTKPVHSEQCSAMYQNSEL